MSVIITLVGIPASGKSTFAEKYRKKGYVIASTDEARKTLYGDETIQGNIEEVLSCLRQNTPASKAAG